jgi:hypothetical protein
MAHEEVVDVKDKKKWLENAFKKNSSNATVLSKSRDLVGNRHQWIHEQLLTPPAQQPNKAAPEEPPDTTAPPVAVTSKRSTIEPNGEIEFSNETTLASPTATETMAESAGVVSAYAGLSAGEQEEEESFATVLHIDGVSKSPAARDDSMAAKEVVAADYLGEPPLQVPPEHHTPDSPDGHHKESPAHTGAETNNGESSSNPSNSMTNDTYHPITPTCSGSDHRETIDLPVVEPAVPPHNKAAASVNNNEPLLELDFPAEVIDSLPQEESDDDDMTKDDQVNSDVLPQPMIEHASLAKGRDILDETSTDTTLTGVNAVFPADASPNTEGDHHLVDQANKGSEHGDSTVLPTDDPDVVAAGAAIPADAATQHDGKAVSQYDDPAQGPTNVSLEVISSADSFEVTLGENAEDHWCGLESADSATSPIHDDVAVSRGNDLSEVNQDVNVAVLDEENVVPSQASSARDCEDVGDLLDGAPQARDRNEEGAVNTPTCRNEVEPSAIVGATVGAMDKAGSLEAVDQQPATREHHDAGSVLDVKAGRMTKLAVDELVVDDTLSGLKHNDEKIKPNPAFRDGNFVLTEGIPPNAASSQEEHALGGIPDPDGGETGEDDLDKSVEAQTHVSISTSIDADDGIETQLEATPIGKSMSDETAVFLGDFESPHKLPPPTHTVTSDANDDDDLQGCTKSEEHLLFQDTTEEAITAPNANHQNENVVASDDIGPSEQPLELPNDPVFLGDFESPHKLPPPTHAVESDACDDDIKGCTKSEEGLLFQDTTEETVMASNANHRNKNDVASDDIGPNIQSPDMRIDQPPMEVKDIITSISSESSATYGLTPLAHVAVHSTPKASSVDNATDQLGVNQHRVDISKMDFLSTRKGKAFVEQAKSNAKKLRKVRDDIINDPSLAPCIKRDNQSSDPGSSFCCGGELLDSSNNEIPTRPVPVLVDDEKRDHEASDSSDVHYNPKHQPSPTKSESLGEVQTHCLESCSIM